MSVLYNDPAAEGVALPAVGEVVAGRYAVERFIARGGMAHVFAARHTELGSALALKVLDPAVFVGVKEARLRFSREARLASQLKHPSIVEVFDVGVTATGLPFMAMELLVGDSLAQLMADRGPMPWPVARDLMLQILDAVQVAHAAGAIHRDIKPDNCVVVPNTLRVKLLDFGIARVLHDTKVTRVGSVMGTPHYLAPEQAQGAETDVRTDVYSAGVVLYEMLTGHCPFEDGDTMEIVGAHVLAAPPPLSSRIDVRELPVGLPELLERVLAKEPSTRPPDAGSFAAELRALDGRPAKGTNSKIWFVAAAVAFVLGISAAGVAKLLAPKPSVLAASLGSFAALVLPPQRREPEPLEKAEELEEPEPEPEPDGESGVVAPTAVPEVVLDEPQAEPQVEPEIAEPTTRRRTPSRKTQVARKVRKAVSKCSDYAPPGGARVSLRASVEAGGKIGGVQLRPPYAGSALGRCVAKAVGGIDVGRGSAVTFDQSVVVGG